MKYPARAHSPRQNRNINIMLNNYIRCIDCRIGLSTINYLVILDIHRCKITKDYRKRKATCLLLLIGNECCTRCSSPATLIFRSSHSFITLSSSALYFVSLVHYIISPTSITLSITSGMFFFVFKLYLLQKRCSLNVLNMILETPKFKVTNIIFESYEHRSKIILQLLTSFVFLKVGYVPHMRIYS